jgi:hypothetical protein
MSSGQGGEQGEEQRPERRAGVDPFRDADERHALLLAQVQELDALLQAAERSIELPDR